MSMEKDYYPYEEHKWLIKCMNVFCCPFCGKRPYISSCDRIIEIGCENCGIKMYSHGILQSDIKTSVVTTTDKATGKALEWYDKDAYEKALKKWNTRTPEPPKEVKLDD